VSRRPHLSGILVLLLTFFTFGLGPVGLPSSRLKLRRLQFISLVHLHAWPVWRPGVLEVQKYLSARRGAPVAAGVFTDQSPSSTTTSCARISPTSSLISYRRHQSNIGSPHSLEKDPCARTSHSCLVETVLSTRPLASSDRLQPGICAHWNSTQLFFPHPTLPHSNRTTRLSPHSTADLTFGLYRCCCCAHRDLQSELHAAPTSGAAHQPAPYATRTRSHHSRRSTFSVESDARPSRPL
jgi:hypothetical protein